MTIAYMTRCDGNGSAAEVSEGVPRLAEGVADMTRRIRESEGAIVVWGRGRVPGRSVCSGAEALGCEWLESMEGI